MNIVGSGSWNVGIGPEKGEVVDDEEGLKNMHLLGENMVWLLKQGKDVTVFGEVLSFKKNKKIIYLPLKPLPKNNMAKRKPGTA